MEFKSSRLNRAALRSGFLCGAATLALGAAIAPAFAQDTGLETVVVTGTSIRGAQPTGSNIIAVDSAQIAATGATTLEEMYSSIPEISSFGVSSAQSQGIFGNESQPTIHNFGESSSNSTLVLMNGRPIMPQGSLGASDPSIIPTIAVQRVDVMPDGDSAIYGSSAVAGVINFITAKDFSGLQTNAAFGRAQGYQRASIGTMAGANWNTGSVTFAYEWKSNSSLAQSSRAFSASANLVDRGGANFGNENCIPGSIATSSTGNVFLYPYTNPTIGTTTSISAANTEPCDNSGQDEFFPSSTTNTMYLDLEQDIGQVKIDLNAGFNYRSLQNRDHLGSVTATAFGPTGSSAAEGSLSRNPFYVSNASTGTASEYVRYDLTALEPAGQNDATSKSGAQDVYDNLEVSSDVAFGWEVVVDQTASWANDQTYNDHGFCSSCATLALNGTTNSGATANNTVASTAVVDPFGLPDQVSVTRALTTSDALDVWDPAATNKTSPTVLKELFSDQTSSVIRINMNDEKVKFDGPLFDLPAGPLKAAFGAEYNQVNYYTDSSGSDATGSSLVGGSNNNQILPQTVQSIFLEFAVPVVSPEMGVPFMQSLNLQVAGRIDGYSTTGWTHNPKLGFTWDVVDGFAARGSYGTSFTAPNVTFVNGVNTLTNSTQVFTIPTNQLNYPGSFCTGPGAPNPCAVGANFPGVEPGGPNTNLKPMTGDNYSAGIDVVGGKLWAPLSGLDFHLTYWNTRFNNAITLVSPIGAGFLTTPGLEQYLQIAPPGGWTTTSPIIANLIATEKVTAVLPATIYYIANQVRVNGFSVDGDGLDLDTHYVYSTSDLGDFTWGYDASYKLDWTAKGGPISSPGTYISYKNGRYNTSVILAEAYEARMSVGWALDPFQATFFWNYTNPYWDQISTGSFSSCTYTTQSLCPTGYPSGYDGSANYSGGFERVKANDTFDLDINYNLPADWLNGWTKGTTLNFNVRDLLDSRPPFVNGGGGCSDSTYCNALDPFNGDPLERVFTFDVRKTF